MVLYKILEISLFICKNLQWKCNYCLPTKQLLSLLVAPATAFSTSLWQSFIYASHLFYFFFLYLCLDFCGSSSSSVCCNSLCSFLSVVWVPRLLMSFLYSPVSPCFNVVWGFTCSSAILSTDVVQVKLVLVIKLTFCYVTQNHLTKKWSIYTKWIMWHVISKQGNFNICELWNLVVGGKKNISDKGIIQFILLFLYFILHLC